MTDEPTIRDVLAEMKAMEVSLRGEMKAMEQRLTQQIAAAKDEIRITQSEIRTAKSELSNEISEAYAMHDARIRRLETAAE